MSHSHHEKTKPISVRKQVKRKPKDEPKRPLSAYNCFFREERTKIVVVVEKGADLKDDDPGLTDEEFSKLRKKNGKVSFEEMGKAIGRRWKEIDERHKEYYQKLADEDADRYKMEMQKYNTKQEKLHGNYRKQTTEIQKYAQMVTHGPHPSIQIHASYSPPMANVSYPMDQNYLLHVYPQMHMIGGFYPYHMPNPNHEGYLPNEASRNLNTSYYRVPANQQNILPHVEM